MMYYLLAILVAGLVTYALRGAVFVLFPGGKELPGWLSRLGDVLPAAIMSVLVVYCLRGARDDMLYTGVPGLIAVLVTGVSYKWKHSTFISIVLGTAVYMVLIRVM